MRGQASFHIIRIRPGTVPIGILDALYLKLVDAVPDSAGHDDLFLAGYQAWIVRAIQDEGLCSSDHKGQVPCERHTLFIQDVLAFVNSFFYANFCFFNFFIWNTKMIYVYSV